MNLGLFIIMKPLKTNWLLFEKINYYQWTFNFQAKRRQRTAYGIQIESNGSNHVRINQSGQTRTFFNVVYFTKLIFFFSLFPFHMILNPIVVCSLHWHVYLLRLLLLFIDMENANGCDNILWTIFVHNNLLFFGITLFKCGARVCLCLRMDLVDFSKL